MTSEKRAQKFHTDDVSLNKQDLGSVSDWLKQISHVARPIRSTCQIREVILHQYGSALVSQTSFLEETWWWHCVMSAGFSDYTVRH